MSLVKSGGNTFDDLTLARSYASAVVGFISDRIEDENGVSDEDSAAVAAILRFCVLPLLGDMVASASALQAVVHEKGGVDK